MLNPDYSDILSIFASKKVEYLVVGAYALAAHGHPRATGDIDLWIRRSPENARRVMQALEQFGAPLSDISQKDFQTPSLVFQIGVSPRRIDLRTTIEGVDFNEAWSDRVQLEIDGLEVPVLSRRHLIENKRALGRPQDKADIAQLEANDQN